MNKVLKNVNHFADNYCMKRSHLFIVLQWVHWTILYKIFMDVPTSIR